MSFLILLLVATIAYLIWRIADQMPDLIFRVSEMQRDVAELRRTLHETQNDVAEPPRPPQPEAPRAQQPDVSADPRQL